MYRFYLNGVSNEYHFEELTREFMDDSDFEVIRLEMKDASGVELSDNSYLINPFGKLDSDGIKRELYYLLESLTGVHPGWGTLTGVRPLKLAWMQRKDGNNSSDAMHQMKYRYLISDNKLSILKDIMDYQEKYIAPPCSDKYSIYVGIPFCPSRCSYCAFASNVAGSAEIELYFDHLLQEINYTGALLDGQGAELESIYIGGGTPTTLDANQLSALIEALAKSFRFDPKDLEFTVEAGRPDTITEDKLRAIRSSGVDRISINPQSMKADTLQRIGRSHSPDEIIRAFEISNRIGFRTVNSDVIAGLPGENLSIFADTLEKLVSFGANNITVHTLSVKRGSGLREDDPSFYRKNVETVREMLDYSRDYLRKSKFHPYYIYRQKHQTGSLENVGYCTEGAHSIYNVRIMEEKQTIVGMGAGAIGKIYYPENDRLERVPNVSNYRIYSERFDEMLRRKNMYIGG